MKKLLLAGTLLLAGGTAHAQIGSLVQLGGLGLRLGAQALTKPKLTPEQKAALKADEQKAAAQREAASSSPASSPTELHSQRTAPDKLPKKGAEQITALEAQLEQCRTAMQASATGAVCTPEQRTAIQQAAVSVARANPGWSLQPYQQEMAFYAAEDARRQQAAATPAR